MSDELPNWARKFIQEFRQELRQSQETFARDFINRLDGLQIDVDRFKQFEGRQTRVRTFVEPVRPEVERKIAGHGSLAWETRPATPRFD